MLSPLNITLLALGLILGLLASVNNASIGTGILIGAGVFKRRKALIVSALGVLTGTIMEGIRMSGATSKLTTASQEPLAMASVLLSTIIVLYLLTVKGMPVSITQMTVSAILSVALLTSAFLNVPYLLEIISGWVLAPLASLLLSSILYKQLI